MLFIRSALAVGMHTLLAISFWISGDAEPWRSAADYWILSFAFAEFINLALLGRVARLEGIRLRDVYNLGGRERGRDLAWTGVALLVAAPLVLIPSLIMSTALWGENRGAVEDLIFQPVAIWAAWATLFVFPVIHALTELPTYFGYVMPRLQALSARIWLPFIVTASVLSVQHMFLPLLFDWRYIVWRAVMFLPLTLWLGWIILRRPTSLPYVAAAHGLLDLSLPLLVLQASLGA